MEIPTDGINVAVNVQPNPGRGKYVGVDLATGEVVFEVSFEKVSSNMAQYFAIMQAIIKHGNPGVYTNSTIARKWILNARSEGTVYGKKDRELKAKADEYLGNMAYEKNIPRVALWQKEWGEMPAKGALND